MSPTLVAATSVASALALMLGGVAFAKSLVRQNVTTNVTITRVNGQKVTQERGVLLSWAITNGHMVLEYEPDSIYSDGFERETR